MKLIIDIPDNETFIGWYTHNDGVNQYHKAKTLGEPNYILLPDNATNGDVIKTLFQNLKITTMDDTVSVMGEHYEFNNFYPLDFWNAPYQKGGKK